MRGSTVLIVAIIIGALIGGAVMGIPAIRQKVAPNPAAIITTTDKSAAAVTTTETPVAAPVATTQQPAEKEAAAPAAAPAEAAPQAAVSAPSTINVAAALAERTLGDKNAPIVFYDYSSLSCPHCAEFHTRVLPIIKKNYIDTGKVKMVFRPFPLNEPALMGEKIARCVPESDYFPMLDMLFSNQEKWVFGNPDVALRQIVKVAGVNDALFDACIKNKELEEGIVAVSQKGVEKFNIKGTPTFIFGSDGPDGEIVTGETDYDAFSRRLDVLLSKKMISPPGKN